MKGNPYLRLVVRAVLAGALVALEALSNADDPLSSAVLRGAIIAGVWAALEYVTPLNRLVGVGK